MLHLTPNRKAFLSMIAHSEGTSTSPATKNDGYDVIVTGIDGHPDVFTDYSHHPFENRPPKLINSRGLESTASGRYQILLRFWLIYKQRLNLFDFSQDSQDIYALQQLREHSALAAVDAGHFDDAVGLITGLWASLPGKAYLGQHQNAIAPLRAFYAASGGVIAA